MLTEAVNHFIEPLTKVTMDKLRPLALQPTDRLKIGLDKEGKYFTFWIYNSTAKDGYPGPSYQAGSLQYRILETYKGPPGTNFKAAITDTTVITVFHSWPETQIEFEAPEIKLLFYSFLLRFNGQFERTKEAAEFKATKKPVTMPTNWKQHSKYPLSEYQKAAIKFCLASPTSMLLLDTGLGKTACGVSVMDTRAADKFLEWMKTPSKPRKMLKVLIVCPAAVLTNWREEIKKFTTTRGKITICRGTKFKRVQQIAEARVEEKDCMFSALIVSYDTLASETCYNIITLMDWDLMICDESHNFKDSSTNRYEALVKVRAQVANKIELTATPIGNSVNDLFAQFEILGEGMSGFAHFANFRRTYGIYEEVEGAQGIQRLVALQNMPFLQERLARLSFAMTKDEAGLELPPKIYDIYEVEMTTEQSKAYVKMATELSVELEDALTGHIDKMQANHALTALLRLAQITCGFYTLNAIENEEGMITAQKKIIQINPGKNPKILAVLEMLQDPMRDPLSKTIIWCRMREDIRALSEALTLAKINHRTYFGDTTDAEREATKNDFNNDDTMRVMIANPATAGAGLNLLGYNPTEPEKSKMYAGHAIFFSQGWSSLTRKQAEDRMHRRGTRCQVRITDLTVPDTIDEEIRQRVQQKQETADSITDIRDVLTRILGK